jgi:hypothetical protein
MAVSYNENQYQYRRQCQYQSISVKIINNGGEISGVKAKAAAKMAGAAKSVMAMWRR